jgi:hypothetical protein
VASHRGGYEVSTPDVTSVRWIDERGARWISGTGLGLVVVMVVVSAFMGEDDFAAGLVFGVWLAALGTVGALVAARRPRNPIGWLLLSSAALISLFFFGDAYASYSLELGHGPLPLDRFMAWLTLWVTVPGFGAFIFVFLLFPDGRLLSARWQWLVWIGIVGLALTVFGLAIRPGPIDSVPIIDNPFGVQGADRVARFLTEGPGSLMDGFVVLAAVTALVLRIRRSRGTERQQMRWFVFAVVLFVAVFGAAQILWAIVEEPESGGPANTFGFFAIMLSLIFIPVSMGIGILRYRLYDIDVIVNKTLVYGGLTAILALAYVGIVVALQNVIPGADDSDLTIAGSTLAVAALFRPLRARMQGFIDRRFYRRKFDTQRTLESFSSRLREDVDLDHLSADLLGVVHNTMQPAHASLWLKPARRAEL